LTVGDRRSVVAPLHAALLAAGEIRPTDDLTLVSRVERRRSTLYFVALAADPRSSRWVVKQPSTHVRQPDLRSPLTAQEQYDALAALRNVLDLHGAPFSAPRPLAVLPEVGAFAMEFVAGRSIPQLLGPRALVNPQPLADAITSAATLLQLIHRVDRNASSTIASDLNAEEALGDARRVLEQVRLPHRRSWFDNRAPDRTPLGEPPVLLHGDFAPENVVIASGTLNCLDPELAVRGPAEIDVVRFLTMLCDAPPFVVTAGAGPMRNFRRRLAADFVRAYYGPNGPPNRLQPMLVQSLVRRWAQRHEHVGERGARAAFARKTLLRVYFSRLLSEVSSDIRWP
jgi:aminoglycoside phosphotransferase (APT) family kinase protein